MTHEEGIDKLLNAIVSNPTMDPKLVLFCDLLLKDRDLKITVIHLFSILSVAPTITVIKDKALERLMNNG